LTSELLTWRRTLEGRFAFNPREPLNPADISTLRGALAKRKVEAENRLRGAVLNLQNTAAYARDLRSSLSRSAQHAFTQLEQAKLDERKGAGHFYKPVKAIAVICAVVGIFTSGMLSQEPTTRQPQKAEVANKSPSSSQGQPPTSSPPRSTDVPTNKFASPTERVLPTTPQPTKPEARLPKPEKPGDPPAVADNGFRTPGGMAARSFRFPSHKYLSLVSPVKDRCSPQQHRRPRSPRHGVPVASAVRSFQCPFRIALQAP
jgi:hypothetical protein